MNINPIHYKNQFFKFQIIDYVEKYGKSLLDPLKYNLLNTTFSIIQMMIDEAIEANADDYQKFLVSWIQAAAMFAIAWGMGGILSDESRKEFDQFHKKVIVYNKRKSFANFKIFIGNNI